MKFKITILLVIASISGLFIFFSSVNNASARDVIKVYQSRTCGCCKKWVAHLENSGFKVESILVDDVTPMKEKLGVPKNLVSCHTASVRGLIIEGHVPSIAIRKLLDGPKSLRGIAVPGMPIGSPGMEGHYNEPYEVISFSENSQSTFMKFN